MPCSGNIDWGPASNSSDIHALQRQLTELSNRLFLPKETKDPVVEEMHLATRVACTVLTVLEANTKNSTVAKIAKNLPMEVVNWWENHKKFDQEKASAKEKLKLAGLTDKEKTLLGITE